LLTGKTILCKSYITPLSIGDIKIFGKCENAVIKQNRFDYNEYLDLMSNGIWGKFTVDSLIIAENISFFHKIEAAFREQVLLVLDKIKNKDHISILRASFLNEKEYLSSDIKLAFRKSGIYHLLAISGLHAGMLIAATYLFLTLLPISSNHKHCIALIILWLYQLFIGFIPSLFRATIMATFIITTLIFQKKNYALQSIGLAGTIWLLYSPESLFLPGYQLSFAATYGIIILSNVFNELVPKTQSSAINFLLSKVISIFSVSLSGFLSTAPVLIYHFGTLSMFGLVANLIAVSLMGYCMWTFFISLLFISFLPLVSETAIRFSSVALDLLIKIANSVKYAPWSELVLYVPHFEVLLIYLLTLCGIATIKKKYTITYLKLAVPIFLILVPLCILLREIKNNQIKTETFKGKNTKITAVLWPHNGIWLFCEGKEPQVSLTISNSVKSWVRHQPNSFLEKSFLINPAIPNTLIEKNKTDLFKLCPIGAAGSKLKRTDNLNESAEAQSIQFRNTYTCEIKKDKYLIILIRDGEQSIQINLGEPLFIEGKIK
jgi:ComEC/Rec2-related protein